MNTFKIKLNSDQFSRGDILKDYCGSTVEVVNVLPYPWWKKALSKVGFDYPQKYEVKIKKPEHGTVGN